MNKVVKDRFVPNVSHSVCRECRLERVCSEGSEGDGKDAKGRGDANEIGVHASKMARQTLMRNPTKAAGYRDDLPGPDLPLRAPDRSNVSPNHLPIPVEAMKFR